ncbi:MAG: YifB family Mg chelatase-like AAA ATPase [Oscillospiraceae bacterium]|nr:YifB family Mg chelatase-like AAA ATPase [Oscillospiraceae bacterium]
MLSSIHSMGLVGLEAYPVGAEVFVSRGMPAFDIVGLPDAAVKESRNRVAAVIKNCGFTFPSDKITVNLSPADKKKSGPLYDLPILLGILDNTGQLPVKDKDSVFIGELSLAGDVRPVNGALPMTISAKNYGYKRIYLPFDNAGEGGIVDGIDVIGIKHFNDIINILRGHTEYVPVKTPFVIEPDYEAIGDFSEIKGQEMALRAIEVAASGGHNMLFIGPPGSGKSMMAKRLPTVLPPLSFDEAISTTNIYSIAGLLSKNTPFIINRPFRSPHSSVSIAALAGGGTIPKPGEISLAHNGVLFLDEFTEFTRDAREALRQPIEDNIITIPRAAGTLTFPCSIMLVAAMNPCACGYLSDPKRYCRCSDAQIISYLNKISGPLLERIDIQVDIQPVEYASLEERKGSRTSAEMREKIIKAREIQQKRFANTQISCNARITPGMMADVCAMTDNARKLIREAFERLNMSARAYDRVLKVSRTIADLCGADIIDIPHIAESIQYRGLDRKYWGDDFV